VDKWNEGTKGEGIHEDIKRGLKGWNWNDSNCGARERSGEGDMLCGLQRSINEIEVMQVTSWARIALETTGIFQLLTTFPAS
jgi:hypothetical protein